MTNNKWPIIKLLIISLLTIVLTHNSSLITPYSIAQESSSSGSLVDKINELKNEIASKAAQIKSEINKKVQNKAIIGSIIKTNEADMIIQGLNSTKTVKFDEFSTIIDLNGKEIKIDSLEESDTVAALGDMDDKNNLVAQRIIYLNNFASASAQLVWGQIQKTSGSTVIIKNQAGETENIITNNQTEFFLGNEEASLEDAKPEKHLVARTTRNKDGSLRSSFIYFIPSMGFTKPEKDTANSIKNATQSASKKTN